MKTTRKLIPAIAMLLISAVMMTTASFAWFSMNETVTASGMNVQATTAMNLVISNNGSTWSSATSAADPSKQILTPASTAIPASPSTKDLAFFAVPAEGVNPDNGAIKDGAAVVSATADDDYFVKYTFYVKIDGQAGSVKNNLYVSEVSVAAATKNISKALRVAVTAANENADGTDDDAIYQYIFAPVSGYTAAYKGLVAARAKDATTEVLSANNVTISTAGTNTTLGKVTSDATVAIDVYVWYEGQDANCTTSNSINVEDLAITVKFSMTDTLPSS